MKAMLTTITIIIGMLASVSSLAGDLRGIVTDATGGTLPGSEVRLTQTGSGHSQTIVTGDDGRYLFPNLEDGRYLLQVQFGGFRKVAVTIAVAGQTRHDLMLELSSLAEQIVVTGTRIPTPLHQEGRSVSVITAQEIELRQQRFVYDALQSLPGIQVTRSGSFGSLSTVSIRGLESDQTLVVQDGIVLNNPATFGNSFDFSSLDTSDIQRIEVIRGAQSTLYGSDAIGGVINIVSREGGQGFKGSGFMEGGSFGTFRGGATVRGGNQRISGRATVSGITTGGFSSADEANGNTEEDGFDSLTFSGRGRYRALDTLTLQGVVRYQDSRNEFDGFSTQPVDSSEIGQSEDFSLGGFVTLDTLSGRLSHRGSVTYSSSDRLNLSEGTPTFDSSGTRVSYEYKGTARPSEQSTLVFGAEHDLQEATTAVGFGGNQQIETNSGYGLLQVKPHQRVTLTGGVRHDSSSDFGSKTTFNGAGAVEVPRVEVIMRASYSEGFRAPTAGELGFNGNLFAESSQGWDVGAGRSFLKDRIRLGVTYFDQKVEDLIAFDLAEFTFVNIQEFDTSGVEFAAGLQLHPTLWLDLSYTYLDALNVSTTIAAGNQPDNRFTAEAAWRPTNRLALSLGVLFNGEELDGFTTLGSYTLLNLRGSYRLTDHLDFIARVENVTDADYQNNLGFGTAPLAAFAGFRTRF